MGMLAGSVVVSQISSKWATWTAMIFLLVIHLGTNYLAVRAVCMRTLNRQRANLAFSTALDFAEREGDGNLSTGLKALTQTIVPSPNDVRFQERVFERDGVLRWGGRVLGYCSIGVDLQTLLKSFGSKNRVTGSYGNSEDLGRLLETFDQVPYIIWYDEPKKTFLIVLEDGVTPVDELYACKSSFFERVCPSLLSILGL